MTEKRLGEIIDIKHGYAFDGEHIVSDDNGIVLLPQEILKSEEGLRKKNVSSLQERFQRIIF